MDSSKQSLFSEDVINVVRETWSKLETDGSSIGKAIFLKLFKDHPTYQLYFDNIKDVPYSDLLTDRTFIRHVTTVEKKLNFAVNTLDDTDKLVTEMSAIGKKHIRFHLTEDQFRTVQVTIEDVLKNALGNEYNETVQKAWNEILSAAIGVIINEAITNA